jgi:hypothetical protein
MAPGAIMRPRNYGAQADWLETNQWHNNSHFEIVRCDGYRTCENGYGEHQEDRIGME